jgi:hypothetical protein
MFHDGGDGEIPMLDQIQNNNFIVSVGMREREIGTGEGRHKLDQKVIFSWTGITADIIVSCCTSSSSRANQRQSARALSATTWAGQRSALQQQLPACLGQYHPTATL